MSPQRIQRKRTRGWRTPLCTCGCGQPAIYVGRPGKWGNPYRIERRARPVGIPSRYPWHEPVWQVFDVNGVEYDWATTELGAREVAVQTFIWVECEYRFTLGDELYPFSALGELRGHDLMCWCPLEDLTGLRVPCHADVLLELANA